MDDILGTHTATSTRNHEPCHASGLTSYFKMAAALCNPLVVPADSLSKAAWRRCTCSSASLNRAAAATQAGCRCGLGLGGWRSRAPPRLRRRARSSWIADGGAIAVPGADHDRWNPL